jgi:hypothetical protein
MRKKEDEGEKREGECDGRWGRVQMKETKWYREEKRKEERMEGRKGERDMVRKKMVENRRALHLKSKVPHTLCVSDPSSSHSNIRSDGCASDYVS